jgi:predicted nucleic acid-binding protein
MEAVIDTNVLIYEFIEDSEFHDEVKQLLNGLDNIIIPGIVINEFIYVSSKIGVPFSIIKNKIIEIYTSYQSEVIEIKNDYIINIINSSNDIYEFKNFNDIIISFISKIKDAPLFTYDNNLKNYCGKHKIKLVK